MLNLIKKELAANARYMLLGLVFFSVFAFMFSQNGPSVFTLCCVTFFYSLSTTNLVVDERYKIDLLLTSLPVRRREIVASKYLLLPIVFAICLVLYTALCTVSRLAGFGRIPPLSLESAATAFFVISVFNGITLPLAYRFGAQSTRYVGFIFYFAVFFLSSLLGNFDMGAIAAFLQGLGGIGLFLLLACLAVAVSLLSLFIANRLYAKKDL